MAQPMEAATIAVAKTKDEDPTGKKTGLGGVKAGRPAKKASRPKHDVRFQLKLTEEGRADLDMLVDRVGASGVGEVIRDAIRVYMLMTDEVFVQGNTPLIRDEKSGAIERLPVWRHII